MNRRTFYRLGTAVLGNALGLVVAVPGLAFLLDPLRRRASRGAALRLARLSELVPGEPQAFPVVEERWDAWVKYPQEPVGSVWLVRQAEGQTPAVVAFTAECPHLGCAISKAGDGRSFVCRCHQAKFDLAGKPTNAVPPRAMDELAVELTTEPDPAVVVRFQRFRTQTQEKLPLG